MNYPKVIIVILMFLTTIGLVFALNISSNNYRSDIIQSSGSNASSTNYKGEFVIIASNNMSSANYLSTIGFFPEDLLVVIPDGAAGGVSGGGMPSKILQEQLEEGMFIEKVYVKSQGFSEFITSLGSRISPRQPHIGWTLLFILLLVVLVFFITGIEWMMSLVAKDSKPKKLIFIVTSCASVIILIFLYILNPAFKTTFLGLGSKLSPRIPLIGWLAVSLILTLLISLLEYIVNGIYSLMIKNTDKTSKNKTKDL